MGTHHCEDETWLLDTLGLHHLEHIHTLSVLQRSMVVAMAQNMPDLLTVSLERDTGSSCVGSDGCWPAVDHNGLNQSYAAPLHLLHYSDDGL